MLVDEAVVRFYHSLCCSLRSICTIRNGSVAFHMETCLINRGRECRVTHEFAEIGSVREIDIASRSSFGSSREKNGGKKGKRKRGNLSGTGNARAIRSNSSVPCLPGVPSSREALEVGLARFHPVLTQFHRAPSTQENARARRVTYENACTAGDYTNGIQFNGEYKFDRRYDLRNLDRSKCFPFFSVRRSTTSLGSSLAF